MRKIVVGAVALALVGTSCGGLFGGDASERTIFVDFSHDEFNSFFLFNFPKKVDVHPGTTLVFRQTWTGEPHTVTGGTLVNDMMVDGEQLLDLAAAFEELVVAGVDLPEEGQEPDTRVEEILRRVEAAEDRDAADRFFSAYDALREQVPDLPDRQNPGDATNADLDRIFEEVFGGFFESLRLPWALDFDEEGKVYAPQNAGQPCYLTEGVPPEEADEPCPDERQSQPAFDGSHSYYNSGIVPFEGPQGNTYRVELADDLEPGSYWFYCAVHGPFQATEVEVKPSNEQVPSAQALTREARLEIDKISVPLREQFRQATSEGAIDFGGDRIEGPFAGLPGAGHAGINEFVPRRRTARVGEPITWKMMGADHSITFDVPEYFPVVEFERDGAVRLNPRLQPPAGGAPEPPEPEEGSEEPLRIDGGTYDGEGFWSSGLIYGRPYVEYTVRISKPGTYRYACLIHPPMVGTVEIT